MTVRDPVWAVGIDVGGTKIEVAAVSSSGAVRHRVRLSTDAADGPGPIEAAIAGAVRDVQRTAGSAPSGVGVGMAGQIDPASGDVIFSPNLDWHNVPLRSDLTRELGMPVAVTNDVRAATWGEWIHGAGRGSGDLVCVFVGTGIGGGVVSGGRLLAGCTNTAGEIGHLAVEVHGPPCTCGGRGCLEALAGGWAIARRAREALAADPSAGPALLRLAGGRREAVTAQTVAEAARTGDPLARTVMENAAQALVAGCIGIVNAFNPCLLILGGGVIEGTPDLIGRVDEGVRAGALSAATASLRVVPAQLRADAGVIGAAAMAMHTGAGTEGPP